MMYFQSAKLAELPGKLRLPATSMFQPVCRSRWYVHVRGPDMPATMDRLAVLLAKVLGGAKPGEIPIEWPIKFEFVVNQRTAKAISLTIPDTVLVRADDVIR